MEKIIFTQLSIDELRTIIREELENCLANQKLKEKQQQELFLQKQRPNVLSFEQGCKYLGYTKSYMYKLTMAGIIPFSKPNGKTIFFDRELLDKWMLKGSNVKKELKEQQRKRFEELEIKAATYISTHPL